HQLTTILVAAHEVGILHRDLKPQNVMLTPDPAVALGERVKLLDFGIAKLLGDTLQADGSESALQTGSGAMLGTPAYMAPEQCKSSGDIDGKADVYAVGVMAFQMLSGRLPFWDTQPMQIIITKLADEPPSLSNIAKEVPEDIVVLVMSMLAREPQQRPSMAEVESQLAKLAEKLPKTRSVLTNRLPPSAPRVTEALAPPLLSTAGDTPSLPILRSEPDRAPKTPAEAQEPGPTPSPLWMSAEQVPASSPLPIPHAPSIGQLPTRPAPSHEGWLRNKGLWFLPLLIVGLTAGMLWRSSNQKSSSGSDAHAQHPVSAAVDLGVPLDLNVPLDLIVSLDMTAQTPVIAKKSDSCHRPTVACVANLGMTQHERAVVISGLGRANVKLCKGERLLLRLAERVSIRLAPLSISQEAREALVVAMSALRSEISYQGDVIVQCGK
ncbi:MAG TPA: protein kinase, partial [Pseudomonadota bacterium]|nr:protein kinase [Pseudomonadota bacterium]